MTTSTPPPQPRSPEPSTPKPPTPTPRSRRRVSTGVAVLTVVMFLVNGWSLGWLSGGGYQAPSLPEVFRRWPLWGTFPTLMATLAWTTSGLLILAALRRWTSRWEYTARALLLLLGVQAALHLSLAASDFFQRGENPLEALWFTLISWPLSIIVWAFGFPQWIVSIIYTFWLLPVPRQKTYDELAAERRAPRLDAEPPADL